MDEPIGQIDRRARSFACGAKGIPFGAAEDLVDIHGPFHAHLRDFGQCPAMSCCFDGIVVRVTYRHAKGL
jgi:hypothetical protein